MLLYDNKVCRVLDGLTFDQFYLISSVANGLQNHKPLAALLFSTFVAKFVINITRSDRKVFRTHDGCILDQFYVICSVENCL